VIPRRKGFEEEKESNESKESQKFKVICYRDRYPDLQTTYANNGEALRDHYFDHGIGEGRNASCDLAGGYVVRTSIRTKHKALYILLLFSCHERFERLQVLLDHLLLFQNFFFMTTISR